MMFAATSLLGSIVLLNLLIARMSESYERIQDEAEMERRSRNLDAPALASLVTEAPYEAINTAYVLPASSMYGTYYWPVAPCTPSSASRCRMAPPRRLCFLGVGNVVGDW